MGQKCLLIQLFIISSVALILISMMISGSETRNIQKRTFASLGCLGIYDRANFTRLDWVCEECYQLFREPDIHISCRQDCFRNEVFSQCVDTLFLSKTEMKRIAENLSG